MFSYPYVYDENMKSVQNIYIAKDDRELWDRLALIGMAERRSMSWLVAQAIREYLDRREAPGATP